MLEEQKVIRCGECQTICDPFTATRCFYCKTWYCDERCAIVHFGLREVEDRRIEARRW